VALPLRGGDPLPDKAAVSAKRRLLDEITDLLAQGQRDGSIADHITAMDVAVCSTLVATPLPHTPDWPTAARRHLNVFIRGIRADS
jgi:hypothetical protein